MTEDTTRIPIATPRPARSGSSAPFPTAPMAKKRGTKGKKIANSLIALSSAAIVSVYGVGYFRTQSAADALTTNIADSATIAVATAAPTPTTVAPTATIAPAATRAPAIQFPVFNPPGSSGAPATGSGTSIAPTATTAPLTATAASTKSAPVSPTKSAAVSGYKDGTFVGNGTSRHGSIQATVVIQGGKIVSASITQCGTRYPCSWITDLPGQVVARQSATVDFVSGATDSSQAYQGAIKSALTKAAA